MTVGTDGLEFEARPRHRDAGVTLMELLMVMIILGIVMSSLAFAMSVALSTAPDADARIDDARSTRGLATWLSHDTTSTPPFMPEQAQGGIIVMGDDPANSNDCSGAGTNLLHLQWSETTNTTRTYVANYRYRTVDGEGIVIRRTCQRVGSGPWERFHESTVTAHLTDAAPPDVDVEIDPVTLRVERVMFTLVGNSGETVRVDTSSRNPADAFP